MFNDMDKDLKELEEKLKQKKESISKHKQDYIDSLIGKYALVDDKYIAKITQRNYGFMYCNMITKDYYASNEAEYHKRKECSVAIDLIKNIEEISLENAIEFLVSPVYKMIESL